MDEDTSPDVAAIVAEADIEDAPLLDSPANATTTTEAPSTESTQATDEADGTEEAKTDEAATEAKDTEATETTEAKAEEAQPTEQPADKGKPDPQIAREAYLERQRTRQAVEQQLDQTYGPKTQDELYQDGIDQGLTEDQAMYRAEVAALREEMQYNQQRTQIAELNAGMQAEAVNAMNDFPMFNEKSPEYDPAFTKMVETQYQTAARLQYDQSGIILNAEVPLYDFYKSMADIYNRGSSRGATKAQAETTETLSRVESVAGGSSTTNKHAETLEEMGERLANMPLI